MLESIHAFALERLEASDESESMRRRHAAFFLRLVREADADLRQQRQEPDWLGRLETDYHNISAALVWARGREHTTLQLRFASALGRFWLLRGRLREGRSFLAEALEANRDDVSHLVARSLAQAAILAYQQGDSRSARDLHQLAADRHRLLDDAYGLSRSLLGLMLMTGLEGDDERSAALSDEIVSLQDRLEGHWDEVNARRLHNLAVVALTRGRYGEARKRIEAELGLARRNGWQTMIANALCDLGHVAEAEHRHAEAHALFSDSLRRGLELGWPQHIHACLR